MKKEDKQQKIDKLRGQIASCRRCALYATRTNTVPGEGDVDAKLMFIGEAPGRNEDLQGKPFVGRAGDVFDNLLESIGLTRKDIYLCNVLKCRPPSNRNPSTDEIKACKGSLDLQIKTVEPKVLCPMGNFAVQYLFDRFGIPPAKISAVKGTIIKAKTEQGEVQIVPLFHPAVATYSPSKIEMLLEDFQVLKKFL